MNAARRKLGGKENVKQKKMSLEQVENIFIDKFQEKFKLTKRDIKRAFTFYDADGSGYLDPQELAIVIGNFTNGVERELVDELVCHYDIDGSGNISLDEFTQFLLSRTAKDPAEWITVADLKSRKDMELRNTESSYKSSSQLDLYAPSEINEPLNSSNIEEVEYATKMFLGSIHSQLLKRARQVWKDRKVPSHVLKNKTGGVVDDIAKKLFLKPFRLHGYLDPGSNR